MKRSKRWVSLGLSVLMAVSSVTAASAASEAPRCDETLYVTLDPYGEVKESSIVKGYSINGASQIVDYGTYDSVINMTDYTEPLIGEGKVIFNLDRYSLDGTKNEGNRFYFEGKLSKLPQELPWKIAVSYRLNGVEKKAEELCGAAGLVEVNIDLTPNEKSSEYFKNNMVLQAATIVDMGKTLSLEAEGAQVQAMGNMKAVLFFALPGEEQHFQIRIGSDDFQFGGMIFMMVPATLAQLDKITDLKEAKETVEDSADALSDSLDVLLDAMDSMQGGLNDTSKGLRELDHSRQIFSDGKGKVYEDADAALAALRDLGADMRPFNSHIEVAQNALNDINQNLNEMVGSLDDLPPYLGDLRSSISRLSDDAMEFKKMMSGPGKDGIDQWRLLLKKLQMDLEELKQQQGTLEGALGTLDGSLDAIAGGLGSLSTYSTAGQEFTQDDLEDMLDDLSSMEITSVSELKTILKEQYAMSDEAVKKLVPVLSKLVGKEGAGVATMSDGQKEVMLKKITALLKGILKPSAGSVGSLETLIGDLQLMIGALDTTIEAAESQGTSVGGLLNHMDDMGDAVSDLCEIGQDLISDVDTLNNTINRYHDELIATLGDAGYLINTAVQGVDTMHAFFTTFENQLKSVGDSLNAGTKMTLNGLADSLDQALVGLSQTDTIRNAKNTVKDLIEDKWDEYTGEDNNMLNIDPYAAKISFTSTENQEPESLQIILRTEEITNDDDTDTAEVDENFHPEGNFFQRIWNIIKKIWTSITSLFS